MDDVFDAGARGLREVMLPRTEVDFLPGDMPAYKAVREVLQAPHSRYPVMGDSADDIIGFVHVRDLLDPEVSNRSTPVADLVRPVVSLPDTVRVLRALSDMRRESSHLAIVLDEYGGTAGIVTMEDLVEELVGDITDEYDVVVARPAVATRHDRGRRSEHPRRLRRADRLRAGRGTVRHRGRVLHGRARSAPEPPGERRGRCAAAGEDDDETVRLELKVTELDGRRAARLDVKRVPAETPAGADPATAGTPATEHNSG